MDGTKPAVWKFLNEMGTQAGSPDASKRLLCVDALRGFDMFWIIGGSEICVALARSSNLGIFRNVAVHFDHAWGQFHLYDIIMPLFLFIVGVVMPLSFNKRLSKGITKRKLYTHIIKRVVVLYLLGLITSGHILEFNIDRLHLYTNTLHCIALGYLVSAILILESKVIWQIVIPAILLLVYWGIMALVPIPGHGAGIYEPDLNLALYIDDLVLGKFQEGEGWTYILTSLAFPASVMLGVFAGKILISDKSATTRAMWLTVLGIGCMLAGKVWSIWFPIIHHLWTSSLVLYAGGLSILLLVLFFLVIDVRGYRKWAFGFVVIGMNAIAVYVSVNLFDFRQIGNIFVGGLARWLEHWNEPVQAITAFAVIWLILFWMYSKNTFIKI